MPSARFELPISSLLVRCLTNLATKAYYFQWFIRYEFFFLLLKNMFEKFTSYLFLILLLFNYITIVLKICEYCTLCPNLQLLKIIHFWRAQKKQSGDLFKKSLWPCRWKTNKGRWLGLYKVECICITYLRWPNRYVIGASGFHSSPMTSVVLEFLATGVTIGISPKLRPFCLSSIGVQSIIQH